MGIFGWSLPPGCGTLPDEEDEHQDNSIVEKAFSDYDSPSDLYRAVYKYTPCGPMVGFQISYWEQIPPDGFNDWGGEKEVSRWVYGDELRKLGTWKDMADQGILILAISVSSIVEGVDQCVDGVEISTCPDDIFNLQIEEDEDDLSKTLSRLFYKTVDEVDAEVDSIWHATHGCETCAKHWAGNPDDWTEDEWQVGETNVWMDCPDCGGSGTVF